MKYGLSETEKTKRLAEARRGHEQEHYWGEYRHQQGHIGRMEEKEIVDDMGDLITLTAFVWTLGQVFLLIHHLTYTLPTAMCALYCGY